MELLGVGSANGHQMSQVTRIAHLIHQSGRIVFLGRWPRENTVKINAIGQHCVAGVSVEGNINDIHILGGQNFETSHVDTKTTRN